MRHSIFIMTTTAGYPKRVVPLRDQYLLKIEAAIAYATANLEAYRAD